MGTALIQEFRFNRYCRRLQGLVTPYLDKEFKTFMKHRGVNIDSSSFEIDMLEPQNFSGYREIEINNARAAVFTQLAEIPYLAHRFKLQKFLGLTDDEVLDNERQWREENTGVDAAGDTEGADFSAAGLKGPGESDLDLSAGLGAELAPPEGELGGIEAPAEPLGAAPAAPATPPA
jgi:hypothetical protein